MADNRIVACAAAYFFAVIFLVLVAWAVVSFTSAFNRPAAATPDAAELEAAAQTQQPQSMPTSANSADAAVEQIMRSIANQVSNTAAKSRCTGMCGGLVAQGVIYSVAAVLALVATIACAANSTAKPAATRA